MSKRLWPIFLGPPLILAAAVVAMGRHGPTAEAANPAAVHSLGTCTSAAQVAIAGNTRAGSWWKTVERLDGRGMLIGRTLFVGHGSVAVARAQLPAESSVSGPIHGIVVVVADDGTRSEVRLVSVTAGCEIVVHDSAAVARTAILDPNDGSVLAHLVDRASRADLGTWRLMSGSDPTLVAPPLGTLARAVGTVWGTDLELDAGGTHLAVQSCADLGCLTRIFDLALPGAPPQVVSGQSEGPLLGFAGPDLATWAACPGYPCSVLAWGATNQSRILVELAAAAAMTADGRRVVVLAVDKKGSQAIELDPLTGRSAPLAPLPAGRRPLGGGASATVGLEVANDEIAIGSAGADPQPFRPDSAALEVLR
jgi:hypothetical protein